MLYSIIMHNYDRDLAYMCDVKHFQVYVITYYGRYFHIDKYIPSHLTDWDHRLDSHWISCC